MLQPLDSVRYKTPDLFNREVDTAHARTEVLLAILFGFDIVVSANDIADSRGFMRIFREFSEQGREQLGEFRRRTYQHFRPFKVGLKEGYRKDASGLTAYDAYVADVAGKLGVRRNDSYVNFANIVEVLKEGIRYYQMGAEGTTSLKGGELDELRQHIERVHEYFSPSGGRDDDGVYTTVPIAQNDFNLYRRAVVGSCARLEQRGAGLASRAAATRDSLADVIRLKHRLVNRDDWYAAGKDIENWSVVRSWIDVAMHRRLCIGFDVFLPSFFTQDLLTSADDPELFYGILDDASYEAVRSMSPDESGLMLPGIHEVAWDDILRMVLSREHREKVEALREAVDRINLSAVNSRRALLRSPPPDFATRFDEVRADRRRQIGEALAAHASYLNEQSAGVAVVTRGTKVLRLDDGGSLRMPRMRAQIVERASAEAKDRLERKLEIGSQLGMFGLAKLVGVDHEVAGVLLEGAAILAGRTPATAISGAVTWLRRPTAKGLETGRQLIGRQADRVNISIG